MEGKEAIMGVDCSIWSLDPKTGETVEHDMDRHHVWILDSHDTPKADDEFVTRAEALASIDVLLREAKDRDREWYNSFHLNDARQFIEKSPDDFLFTVVSEHFNVESRVENYADTLIYREWPNCPTCEPKRGVDNISRACEGNFLATCMHTGTGAPSILPWKAKEAPEWALRLKIPHVIYKEFPDS